MPKPVLNDNEFIEIWEKYQSPTKMAKILGITERNVMARRRTIEGRTGKQLKSIASRHEKQTSPATPAHASAARHQLGIENGVVLVFSDAHFWPGIRSTAFKGLLWAIKELRPKAIINNGDAFDGAAISRFPRIGWDSKPSVIDELKACEMALGEIEDAAGNAKLHWTWGNHDIRWNSRLSSQAPEFEGIHGMNLTDHFPRWKFSTSVMVNDHTQIKHRNYNGIHAAYNAVLRSGVSTVNGHLHSLKVTPWTDLTGTRYGVDTGSLADVWGAQFEYTEDGTRNHRSGFVVLTFYEGKLLPPEMLEVIDEDKGLVCFRGQVIAV